MPDDNVLPLFRPSTRNVAPIAPETLARIYNRPPCALPKLKPYTPLNLTPARADRWTRRAGIGLAIFAVAYFAAQMIRARVEGRF